MQQVAQGYRANARVGPARPDVAPARLAAAALAVILLAAAWLRAVSLGYGLPAVYNPDEVAILSRALAFAKGDLNPHNFVYPSFYFYLLFGWMGAFFVAARTVGAVPSLHAFQTQFFIDPSTIYLAARALGVVCGTATVLAVYWFGRRLFGRATGLAAAWFVAVAPVPVIDSHYVKHDVAVTLAIVLAQVAIASLWPLRRRWSGAWPPLVAGAACGAAFSMHYYAVFLAVPLAVAVGARYRAEPPRVIVGRLAVAAAAMAGAFFLLSPFILVEPATAWRDIVANREIVVDRTRTLSGGVVASYARYLQMLWLDAVGWPVAALAAVGSILLAARAWRHAVFVLAFPAAFLLFIGNTVPASRYLNPLIPSVAILAAYGVVRIAGLISTKYRWAVVAAMGVVAAQPAVLKSVKADLFFRETDTRTLGQLFIEASIPDGSVVALQPGSVQLRPSAEGLRDALRENLGSLDRLPTKFTLQLQVSPRLPAYRLIYIGDGGLDADKIYVSYARLGGRDALAALRARGVHYVVVKRYNHPQPATLPFLDALAREGHRLAVFSPYRSDASPEATAAVEPYLHNTDARIQEPIERPGPIIEIWQLNELGSVTP